jgi:hypothetical protein
MTASNSGNLENLKEQKLPLRDWFLLPLLSLLTVLLILGSTELIARRAFYRSPANVYDCMVMNDLSTGPRAIPNCVCREKIPETQWTEYRFNGCGHRTAMECGSRHPGAYRIVMAGSSFAVGARVQEDKTVAELLPVELTRLTGRKVELYNAAIYRVRPVTIAQRFDEVVAAKPDVILWVIAPLDIKETADVLPGGVRAAEPKGFLAKVVNRVKILFAAKSGPNPIRDIWDRSQTALVLRHYLYESQSQYVNSFLMGDDNAGYLKDAQPPDWKRHEQDFDRSAAVIEERATAAGVPLVAVLVPGRAQAAMISMGQWPAGYNPYKLGDELRTIITNHGGTYVDILPDFRAIPNPERFYLPVDGHPNAEGHAMITDILARELTRGAIPALSVDQRPKAVLENEK